MLADFVELDRVDAEARISVEQIPASEVYQLYDEWLDLANNSVEPNYFYAPSFTLASLKHLPELGPSSVVLVWHESDHKRRLIGFVPLTTSALYWGLPIPLLHSWRNKHTSSWAPLLRQGFELPAARALLDGFAQSQWYHQAVYLSRIDIEGAAFKALRAAMAERGQVWREVRSIERIVARPLEDFDAYIARSMSARRRSKYRRMLRNLSKEGEVSFRLITGEREVAAALEDFMALEKASWKGDQASAYASNQATADFLRSACRGGSLGDTASAIHTLCLDDQVIASVLLAKSGDVLWTELIASDVAFKKFSPGVLLAMDVVKSAAHAMGARHIDSASKPDGWVGAFWDERQQLSDVILATSARVPASAIDTFVRLDRMRSEYGPNLRKTLMQGRRFLAGRK